MNEDKVVELNRHEPTVDSVISRLDRHKEKIKHINVIIEWEDGRCGIYGDSITLETLNYYKTLFDVYVEDKFRGSE